MAAGGGTRGNGPVTSWWGMGTVATLRVRVSTGCHCVSGFVPEIHCVSGFVPEIHCVSGFVPEIRNADLREMRVTANP